MESSQSKMPITDYKFITKDKDNGETYNQYLEELGVEGDMYALYEMEKKKSAHKWEKLMAFIKESAEDEDADIWEFLDEELGVKAGGGKNEKY